MKQIMVFSIKHTARIINSITPAEILSPNLVVRNAAQFDVSSSVVLMCLIS